MGDLSGFLDYLMIALALYVLVCAIIGKGKLFEVGRLKEGVDEVKFKKNLRLIYLILGIIMLLNSVSNFFKTQMLQLSKSLPLILTIVFLVVIFGMLVLLIVFTRKYTVKGTSGPSFGTDSSPEAEEHARRQAGHTLPIDAFEFDDTEEVDSASK